MFEFYIGFSVLCAIAWIIFLCLGLWAVANEELDHEEFKIFSAIMSVGFLVIFLHVFLLILAIPTFVVYGFYQGIRLLIEKHKESKSV